MKKYYVLFRQHFYMSISVLTRLSHTGQVFRKKFLQIGTALFLNIAINVHTQNFEQNFYKNPKVCLVRI